MVPKANRSKILRIVTRLNVGGPSHHVYFLSSCLNPDRFTTFLVYGKLSQGEDRYPQLPQADRCVYFETLGRHINIKNDLVSFFGLVRLMMFEKPQIVHTHMAKAGALGRLAAYLCRVPVIIHTYHGHVFDGYFPKWKTKLFVLIERLLTHFSTCVITMGEEIAKELIEVYHIGSKTKVRVMYPGLELKEYLNCQNHQGTFKRKLGFTHEEILVAMIGRLIPIKNPEMFVRVASKVVQKYPLAKFIIIGGGEKEQGIANLIKEMRLEQVVFLLGWRHDLPVIYSDVDIVVLCSRDEGVPNVLIEALASAKPVVATRVGSVAEIVQQGKSGWLVGKENEDQMTEAILSLCQNPQMRQEFGQYGREYVKNHFSKEDLIRRMEELYSELVR